MMAGVLLFICKAFAAVRVPRFVAVTVVDGSLAIEDFHGDGTSQYSMCYIANRGHM